MVSNNNQKFTPPYKTYQQATGGNAPNTQYNKQYNPAPEGPNNFNYNPPVHGGNKYPAPPKYDPQVANTDTVLAAIAWGDGRWGGKKDGGLNRDEIIKTAEAYKGYDDPTYQILRTFIDGGKSKTGFIFDPNNNRLLDGSDIGTLANKDKFGNSLVPRDFQIADPSQFQAGGNTIPGGNPGYGPYPAPQPLYGKHDDVPAYLANKPTYKPQAASGGQPNSQILQKLLQYLSSRK